MKIPANDLKKGDMITMKHTGWKGRIEDNVKGTIRSVFVWGFEAEHGSCYVWDIASVTVHKGVPCPPGTTVEMSASHLRAMKAVKSAGF